MMKKRNKSKLEQTFTRIVNKIVCLSFYGKGGKLQCCWKGCTVTDPDMLSLDHLKDNGNQDKTPGNKTRRGGTGMYSHLKCHNYPKGYQTLCYNHQNKKELLRRRNK